MVNTACIIMAAGQGSRMGGPKALLLWDEQEPLALAHARLRREDCERIIVVCRAPVAEVLRPLAPDITWVESEELEEYGPAGSIASAVRAGALGKAERVLLTPVDVPPAKPDTVQKLWAALQGQVQGVRPYFQVRRGHPVVCRALVLTKAYAAGMPPTLRDVLRGMGERCIDIEVQDPNIVVNLDTPEAFTAHRGRPVRFLS